jgi:hypothetical protein
MKDEWRGEICGQAKEFEPLNTKSLH